MQIKLRWVLCWSAVILVMDLSVPPGYVFLSLKLVKPSIYSLGIYPDISPQPSGSRLPMSLCYITCLCTRRLPAPVSIQLGEFVRSWLPLPRHYHHQLPYLYHAKFTRTKDTKKSKHFTNTPSSRTFLFGQNLPHHSDVLLKLQSLSTLESCCIVLDSLANNLPDFRNWAALASVRIPVTSWESITPSPLFEALSKLTLPKEIVQVRTSPLCLAHFLR